MKLNTILILIFLIPFHAKSDQIYELIKIPNLKLHHNGVNGIKYLVAHKNFSAGIGINSVNCEKPENNELESKFLLTKKNINYYDKKFLKKIDLKFVVLCKNLNISDIPAIGFANPEMKTIILNIDSKVKIYQRVIHHEIFHVIHKNFHDLFDEKEWGKFNDFNFKYSQCSTCTEYVNLEPLKTTNGFFTDYAKSTVSEDMAETYSFLIFSGDYSKRLIAKDPIIKEKTVFIKKNISKIYKDFKFR